ncbi:LPXTG cell wall anchor domain-containing protein [Enterococcus durans]|uniref:LPXTG cell wall anchor domain-containing protein n=1 Tax=Enterococcus durans TaxID=53345 RepID=UPI0021C2C542|nr:LPXTG cell wall anchor domain-containing protein [Enterococcus durans]
MKYLNVLFTSVVLASLAVPVDAAQVDEAAPQYPITLRSTEPGWANVNRITLQDIFLPTNSGIMKVAVGETITVNATVDYSGDLAPILQSSVLFEGVDPALMIGYDPSSLVINQRAARFSFTVTLNRPLTKPALFTVKVADGTPSDNQHLTPYSQRQTIEEASIDLGDEDLIEIPETDGNVGGNKPTIKPEEPDQEVTEPEEPGQEVTEPEEPDQEVTIPPQSETDDTPANETNREVPENTNHSMANSHGKNISNGIIKTQDFDRNTHASVKEVPRIRIDKNEKTNDNSNENYRNEENPSSSDRQSTLPKTAEKSNLFLVPVGLGLLGFTILKLKRK